MSARGHGRTFHIDAFDVTFECQSWRDDCITECPLMTQSGHHLGLGSNSIPVRAYGMLGLPWELPELPPWLILKWLSIAKGIKLGGLEGAQTQESALGFVGSSWILTQYRTRPTFR